MNNCMFAGHLARDPNVGETNVRLDIALKGWDSKAEEETVTYVQVYCYGGTAKYAETLSKGDFVAASAYFRAFKGDDGWRNLFIANQIEAKRAEAKRQERERTETRTETRGKAEARPESKRPEPKRTETRRQEPKRTRREPGDESEDD